MSDRCQPFFQCIKKSTSKIWGRDQKEAFQELKQYRSSPMILSSPSNGETMFLYLAVSEVVVNNVLFREKEAKQRKCFMLVECS